MSRPGTHQAQAIAAGNWALSASFGTTSTVSTVFTGSSDLSGAITITVGGTGIAASPTATLTFKNGAWAVAPFAVSSRGFVTGDDQLTIEFLTQTTTTTLVLIFNGTPTAGQTFTVHWAVFGGTAV